MNCAGCNTICKPGPRLLNCHACDGIYHIECLNIKQQQYSSLTEEFKAAWKCPRAIMLPVVDNPTCLSPCDTLTVFKENIKSSLHDWRDEMEASITKLNDDLKFALNGFREEICTLRAEHERLKHQTVDISHDVSELKASMQFLSGEQDDFKKKWTAQYVNLPTNLA
ncbi:unnamed protein product [Parnassius apollo]|uniref:(apollo) hypothetical protein n=1 Tax=Parnassius apollo TaxID=110799 RepID=A0A8S3W8A6_PARAO|nr:unnamed protein product [Parnassius apollo]